MTHTLSWQEQPLDWEEHVARHAPHALTLGSKFSQDAWEALPDLILSNQKLLEEKVRLALEEKLTSVSLTLHLDNAGKGGVLPIAHWEDQPLISVLRDPGGPYERWVDVRLLQAHQRPVVNEVSLIAGKLDETHIGMITAYPSSASRPFPNEAHQHTNPEFYAECVGFWKHHQFVGEAGEILYSAQHMKTKGIELERFDLIEAAHKIEEALSPFLPTIAHRPYRRPQG